MPIRDSISAPRSQGPTQIGMAVAAAYPATAICHACSPSGGPGVCWCWRRQHVYCTWKWKERRAGEHGYVSVSVFVVCERVCVVL